MPIRVEMTQEWLKVEGQYADVWYGEFDTPSGNVRRCGHYHRQPGKAWECVRALSRRVWTDAR
jgi:hypothetical protein